MYLCKNCWIYLCVIQTTRFSEVKFTHWPIWGHLLEDVSFIDVQSALSYSAVVCCSSLLTNKFRTYSGSSASFCLHTCWPRPHHFYRAILCIRGTSHGPVSVCLSFCLSVRLSVTSWCSTKTAKRRITQTTPHDISGTLVF